MDLNTSYRHMILVSLPIMIGSAVQNIIALSDSVFLFHSSEIEFAAAGIVGVYYLVFAAVGYGFSKAGQIIIARRIGEKNYREAGNSLFALLYLELFLALFVFLVLRFLSPYLLPHFIQSPAILENCLKYLHYRSPGIFFAYTGVVLISFYTALHRTTFIMIDTLILCILNLVLNYIFVFGKWGAPAMGIGGAALASTISEALALLLFVVYLVFDRKLQPFELFHFHPVRFSFFRNQVRLASPILLQSVLGLGSWFLFFGFIEKVGERELAMSNLARLVYLILSIPVWGYSSTIGTYVGNFLGKNRRIAIEPVIWKMARVSTLTTISIALPVLAFPEFFLYPLFGTEDMTLIRESIPLLRLLFLILSVFSMGGVYFSALSALGSVNIALLIQSTGVLLYLCGAYLILFTFKASIEWAWSLEVVYWLFLFFVSGYFLKSRKWHHHHY